MACPAIYLFTLNDTSLQRFNGAIVFFVAAVVVCWALPAVRGPRFGYPIQAISVIWFFIYGLGAKEWLIRGNPNAIFIAYAGGFALLTLALGYLAGKHFVRPGPKIAPDQISTRALKRRMMVFLVLSVLATFYFVAVGGIPAFRPDALVYRFEVRQRVSSYVIFMLRSGQLPVYFMWAMFLLSTTRHSLQQKFWMWGAIGLMMFANFIPGWRNPLMFIAMNLVFIYIFSTKHMKSARIFLISAGSVIGILVMGFGRLYRLSLTQEVAAISYFSQFNTDPIRMFFHWTSAQFSNYSFGFLTALDVFPKLVNHLNGGVIVTTLATMLPGKQELLDEKLKKWSGLDFDGGGLNLTLLGESYADFGVFGLALYPFIYGTIIGLLVRKVEHSPTPARVTLAAFATSSVCLGSLTGLLALSNFWILGGFAFYISLGERIRRP
ncbi:O-antigen polymerase [Parasedimentitalea huanghaiensis]|nr:O-antigen polymerase [Zongyanglinia huanghaiensis]